MRKTIRILVKGKVQQIGFRRYVFKKAIDNNICGHVFYESKNSVVVIAQGEEEFLRIFTEFCRKPLIPKALISGFQVTELHGSQVYDSFKILKTKKPAFSLRILDHKIRLLFRSLFN